MQFSPCKSATWINLNNLSGVKFRGSLQNCYNPILVLGRVQRKKVFLSWPTYGESAQSTSFLAKRPYWDPLYYPGVVFTTHVTKDWGPHPKCPEMLAVRAWW